MLFKLLTLALKSLRNVGMYKEHTAAIGVSQLFSFKRHAQPITSTQPHLSKQLQGRGGGNTRVQQMDNSDL